MPASEQQYDLVAGVDLRTLSAPTVENIIQAINQIAPLSNTGLVLAFSSENGAIWPGITNNPRYKRFTWIDTYFSPPKIMIHDQSVGDAFANWISIGLGSGAITATHLSDGAVTLKNASGNYERIAVEYDGEAGGEGQKIVRVDSGGQYLEAVNIATLVANTKIPVNGLQNSANVGQFLRAGASEAQWETPNWTTAIGTKGLNITGLTAAGTDGHLLKLSDNGIVVVENNDKNQGLFPDGSILISRLVSAAAANEGDMISYQSGTWTKVANSLGIGSNAQISTAGIINEATPLPQSGAGGFVSVVNHQLNGIPKLVRVVFRFSTSWEDWNEGDEVDPEFISRGGGGSTIKAIWADATYVGITIEAYSPSANYHVTTKAGVGGKTISDGLLIPKFYAWL